jgi:hypothetical protein
MALNFRLHGCSSHIHRNGTKHQYPVITRPQYAATAAVPAAEAWPPASVPPPDVAPDVLLLLSSDLQQLDLVGSVTQLQSHPAPAQQQTSQQALQQQQLQPVLLPRTVSRLQGLQQLPGFIPSLAPQPNPQLVLCQQEVRRPNVELTQQLGGPNEHFRLRQSHLWHMGFCVFTCVALALVAFM